jgi:imidazole glycerol-phosphate synthase subunit HisH
MTEVYVCILDYGGGNVGSVGNLLKYLGVSFTISSQKTVIEGSTHLILPGVGAFGSVMEKIKNNLPLDFIEKEVILHGKPFLGICVGMQVLANYGLEFNKNDGLGWIDGFVDLIDSGNSPLPHIGWNNVVKVNNSKLLKGLDEINDFYFVNSYCFKPARKEHLIAETTYHEKFASIVGINNIMGVQFHPEKSQSAGQMLIKNFLKF